MTVRLKRGPSGDALGCNFALPGDTNDKGEPVFYSGSTLAPDLSLPQDPPTPRHHQPRAGHRPAGQPLAPGHRRHRTHPPPPRPQRRPRGPGPAGRARRRHWTCSRSPPRPRCGPNSNGPPSPSSAPPAPASPPTTPAPASCAAASRRSGTTPHATGTVPGWRCCWTPRSPRSPTRCTGTAPASTPNRRPQPNRPSSTCRPRTRRSPDRSWPASPAAHPACRPSAATPTTSSRRLPEHAERILRRPRLGRPRHRARRGGSSRTQRGHAILNQALSQRTLDDAHSPARALTWRIRRLGERHAPGPRAQAANAHCVEGHPAAPRPQQPQARRR